MKILSLFDGISCARVALERVGISVEAYFASEIDKYAIQIAKKNFPNTEEIGDVTMLDGYWLGVDGIDLLIGGSPCQDLSIAKRNRKGLDGERSGLFWEYVRILKKVKPKWFLLENVASMPKEAKQTITETLGVEPIMINAALVSAQNRKRLFWTNIPNVKLPDDKGILLKDILENGDSDRLKSYAIDANYFKGSSWEHYKKKGNRQLVFLGGIRNKDWAKDGKDYSRNFGQGDRVYSPDGKSTTLSALGGGRGAKTGLYKTDNLIRKLTPIECERLQGLPDNYTEGCSNTQRYKMLGNAFNVDVVAHILSNLISK